MAQFGWAYIDCSSSGPGGTDRTIQFNSGSTHSGSANFVFNYSVNKVLLTGSAILSGSSTNILTVVGNVSGSNNLLIGNDVTASAFSGGGSNLTNLNASNVSAGTLNTARLPDTMSVTHVTASSLVSASFFYGNGSNLTGISASPVGSNTQIQYNADGAFGADSDFTWASGSNTLTVTGDVSASINVSASEFYGDGSNLTALNASSISAGTLNNARLPANISVTNLAGAGASITALDADNINAGTLNNARLPSLISVTNVTASAIVSATSFYGTGSNIVGLNASNISAGTLNTARLPDTMSVTHVTASSLVSASFFYGNGSNLTGISASPGGSNTQIQYNADGAFGSDAQFTWASGSNTLTVTGDISASANLSASDFYVSEKIFHAGDPDTFIHLTDDNINFQAGGVNFLDLTEDTQNEVTINEGGVDIDLRVESADETHMLFIEGSSNRMSIGDSTDSPAATLEVTNHASAGATGVPLVQLNSNDTDKIALDIDAANVDANVVDIAANSVTTAKVINVSADGLTTGNALYVADDSSNTGTRKTALVIQNNAAAIAATALHVQSDGGVVGVRIDKNYSDTAEASVVGLDIDWDKTGASTSDNTMYGLQIDMDNTTATNGLNTMYGLYVTPTLTHAANAGTPIVYGALINAQGGTNGTSLVQGARIEAGGGDINYGIQLDVEDGGVDLRIESSADSGDYFQIQTTTHGATTITTVDDDATAANLTFTIDGDITLDPAGGNVTVDGQLSASLGVTGSALETPTTFINSTHVSSSLNLSASAFYGDGSNLTNIGTSTSAALHSSSFTVASTSDILAINSSGSVVTASLLAANSYDAGYRLSFKDVQGFAATNNILIKPSGSENIDGSNSGILITTNYGAVEIFTNGVNSYHILSTN
jgi:hypothetical protein